MLDNLIINIEKISSLSNSDANNSNLGLFIGGFAIGVTVASLMISVVRKRSALLNKSLRKTRSSKSGGGDIEAKKTPLSTDGVTDKIE